MIKLKSLTLKSGVISSPMAGCTDLAYRLISRSYGMEFCFLEMVSAEGLVRSNSNTGELMKTLPEDKPLGAQIFGCRPEAMGEAAKKIEAMGGKASQLGLGGMKTKIIAAKVATNAGTTVVVANGKKDNSLVKLLNNENIGTIFYPNS